MCDIWKGNHNLRQLKESDIMDLLFTLRKYQTGQVLMSGGEALLNPQFFQILRNSKKREDKNHLAFNGTHNSEKRRTFGELGG